MPGTFDTGKTAEELHYESMLALYHAGLIPFSAVPPKPRGASSTLSFGSTTGPISRSGILPGPPLEPGSAWADLSELDKVLLMSEDERKSWMEARSAEWESKYLGPKAERTGFYSSLARGSTGLPGHDFDFSKEPAGLEYQREHSTWDYVEEMDRYGLLWYIEKWNLWPKGCDYDPGDVNEFPLNSAGQRPAMYDGNGDLTKYGRAKKCAEEMESRGLDWRGRPLNDGTGGGAAPAGGSIGGAGHPYAGILGPLLGFRGGPQFLGDPVDAAQVALGPEGCDCCNCCECESSCGHSQLDDAQIDSHDGARGTVSLPLDHPGTESDPLRPGETIESEGLPPVQPFGGGKGPEPEDVETEAKECAPGCLIRDYLMEKYKSKFGQLIGMVLGEYDIASGDPWGPMDVGVDRPEKKKGLVTKKGVITVDCELDLDKAADAIMAEILDNSKFATPREQFLLNNALDNKSPLQAFADYQEHLGELRAKQRAIVAGATEIGLSLIPSAGADFAFVLSDLGKGDYKAAALGALPGIAKLALTNKIFGRLKTVSILTSKGMAEFKLNGHHPIPMVMLGKWAQEKSFISTAMHKRFHTEFDAVLLKNGFPTSKGGSVSQADWKELFAGNPAKQDEAYSLLIDFTRQFDQDHASSILPKLMDNIMEKRFLDYTDCK